MTLPHFVAKLSGRLANGAERGKGVRWHSVPGREKRPGEWEVQEWGTALCGARPGRRSGCGFVAADMAEQGVTCPRCLRKLGN